MTTSTAAPSPDAAVAPLVARMASVNAYREALQRLQDVWDQLSLLGRMSGAAADIDETATRFRDLTQSLIGALAQRLHQNTRRDLSGKAQVTIDILVRNLFERTADVGFLAQDAQVRAFLEGVREHDNAGDDDRAALEARFRAYVAKYSVYDDVVVLGPDGRVHARLDREVTVDRSRHALVQATIRGDAPYTECFGTLDVLGGRRGLVYAAPVRAVNGAMLGVLCLSFRFDDEMRAIFARLLASSRHVVIALTDANRTTLASSDPWQIPLGAPLPDTRDGDPMLFAGREYLRVAHTSTGYQGYAGPPGWRACALVPLELAFRHDATSNTSTRQDLAQRVADRGDLFGDELARIPDLAQTIQRGLERSVWNGHVRHRRHGARDDRGFAGALLHQVASTGARITGVFEEAIRDLQRSAIAAVLDDARFASALAIDILDRNLYERANDCRWWALDATLQQALADPDDVQTRKRATDVLEHINGLYTVYANLVLFDAKMRVIATSHPVGARDDAAASVADCDWARGALTLRDRSRYTVSAFAATPWYDDRPTYIYAAGVPDPTRSDAVTGGIAIVFDGALQFDAMLKDALPRDPQGRPLAGAAGLFVDRAGLVVASTDARYGPGSTFDGVEGLATLPRGASSHRVQTMDGMRVAVGVTMCAGYREYRSDTTSARDDLACVMLVPLCKDEDGENAHATSSRFVAPTVTDPNAVCDIAAFSCKGQWLGLPVEHVIEAVEVARLTPLPGSPAYAAGVLMQGNAAVPVVDLCGLRSGHASTRESSATTTVVVCAGADGERFGLRVDALEGVFEVPRAALHAIPECMTHHDPIAESVVQGAQADSDTLLTVLGLARLTARIAHARTGAVVA